MLAKIQPKRESAAVARRSGQSLKPVGDRLQRGMPAVVRPGRVRDADLTQHLRCQVQDRKCLVIAFDAEFRPVGHARAITRLCNSCAGPAKAPS